MTSAAVLRRQYARESVATASPAQLVTMLYDRLVRDLVQAERAIAAGGIAEAHANLVHAQAIVAELATALDTTSWEGGRGLAQLYSFLRGELVRANMTKSAPVVADCRAVVEPLRDAWHQVASSAPAAP